MAVIVTIRVDPITRKSELVGSRLNQASEIWASKGATTRVAFISMGLNAGQFLFAAAFEDFSSTMTAMESVYMVPAMQELMQQREREPGGKMIGPNMFRTIYGELGTLQEKAHLIRYYQMPRHNIPAAIELMGEIDALSDDVNLTAVAPVAHEQMGMIAGVSFQQHGPRRKSHRRSGNVRGFPESGEQSQYPWNPHFCTNEHHPVTHAGEE